MQVLGRANSINVQKVMWISAEIGLDVERLDFGGAFGGNDTSDYLTKNPTGKVPTLVDGDFVLWESNAIVRYLAENFGSAPWYPAEAHQRGHANQWMDFYLTSLHPNMTTVFWTLIRTPEAERDMPKFDAAVAGLNEQWAVVDAHLASTPFMTGPEPGMGDIPVGCAAYRWHNLDLARADLPNLKRWYENLAARPAFQKNVMLPLT